MELLGIGPLEFLLIIVIALIIFSPKDLAKGAKEIGRLINRLYRSDAWKSMRQVSQEMQDLPNRLAREAQLDELKGLEKDLNLGAGSPYAKRPPAAAKPPAAPGGTPPAAPAPPKAESEAQASPAPQEPPVH